MQSEINLIKNVFFLLLLSMSHPAVAQNILLNTTLSNKRLKNMRFLRSTLYNDDEPVYMAFKVHVVRYHGIWT